MVMTDRLMFMFNQGGAHPRYDGTASAHVLVLGGRYDYSFDCHDRLVGAAYTAGADAPDGEDFSAEYAYSETGAPLIVRRRGVVFAGAAEEFGEMDRLSYSWDGALLESVSCEALGDDFYGRTGYQLSASGGDAAFGWNAAGLLVSDSSRGILSARHNWLGQPLEVEFADGSRVAFAYTCGGELLSVRLTPAGGGAPAAERTYCGAFVFEGDSLAMVNFGGGYFDGNGNPYYRHSDWQGSVTMVTDESHNLVQHTGYYPYGEPWREPSGQPYLYGAKERQRDGGLNEYDHSARRLNSALALWTAPDPLALSYAGTNPYAYCASNPIRNVDPNGMWYIQVSASPDRGKNPYAVLSTYSNDDVLVFRTVVRVTGKGRERNVTNNDTPQGEYKILEWRQTGEPNDRYNSVSFGPNDLLALQYMGEEGGSRSGIHLHGGRKQGPELSGTYGCIRIADMDIAQLKQITDDLTQKDPNDIPSTLTVIDSLESPVSFGDRNSIFFYSKYLDELIVTLTDIISNNSEDN